MVHTVRAFACNVHVRVNIPCAFLRIGREFENDNGCTYRGADKSLARPGRKQATATKLFCKPLKKNSEYCPSNQVSAAAMTSASEEKWRPLNCFCQSGRAKDLSAPLYFINGRFTSERPCVSRELCRMDLFYSSRSLCR